MGNVQRDRKGIRAVEMDFLKKRYYIKIGT